MSLLFLLGLLPNVLSITVWFFKMLSRLSVFFLLAMMTGRDIMDSTSTTPLSYSQLDPPNIRVGIPKEYNHPNLSSDSLAAWKAAADLLQAAGCQIVDVELKHTDYSIVCYHILAETDIASNMARFDGVTFGHRTSQDVSTFNDLLAFSRSESLNDTVRRRIFVGNYYNVRE